MRPTLYLLCGLPASGKTTRARRLERSGGVVRLNADEWIWQLYPADPEIAARDTRRDRVEQLQWRVTEQLLRAGVGVVLEWGFWSRAQRDHARRAAESLGADVKLEYLDVPLEVLQRRVAERNRDLPPGEFSITSEELDAWSRLFEPPTADELARRPPYHDDDPRPS